MVIIRAQRGKRGFARMRGGLSRLRRGWASLLPPIAIGVAMLLPIGALSDAVPLNGQAFPGAQGYGAGAVGWRGGAVMAVTNLNNTGVGSLRACAEARKPRVCVFRVGGTIHLDSSLRLRSNIYLAGQTAPGDGIELRLRHSPHGPMVIKNAHDVVLRFLKLRPGIGISGMSTPTIDAVTVENAQNVYLGNLSLMFATDETVNVHVSGRTSGDITLADSIVAYSLDNANHPKGRHSKGALICSDEGRNNRCGRISLIRNLFAHHRDRNPDIKATAHGPVEVVNNIFYNPISQFGEVYDLLGPTQIAYVGNLALSGPSTKSRVRSAVELFDWADEYEIAIWAQDNLAFRWKDCRERRAMAVLDAAALAHQSPEPIPLTLTPQPVAGLEAALPLRVGDVLPDGAGHRDRLDRLVLDDLAGCRGRVIDSPQELGDWIELTPSTAPPDRDGDLFPDAWEAAQPGLDPDRPDDPWAQYQGRAQIEIWLAALAGDG